MCSLLQIIANPCLSNSLLRAGQTDNHVCSLRLIALVECIALFLLCLCFRNHVGRSIIVKVCLICGNECLRWTTSVSIRKYCGEYEHARLRFWWWTFVRCQCRPGVQNLFRYCRAHYVSFCELRRSVSSIFKTFICIVSILLPNTEPTLLPQVCLFAFPLSILVQETEFFNAQLQ